MCAVQDTASLPENLEATEHPAIVAASTVATCLRLDKVWKVQEQVTIVVSTGSSHQAQHGEIVTTAAATVTEAPRSGQSSNSNEGHSSANRILALDKEKDPDNGVISAQKPFLMVSERHIDATPASAAEVAVAGTTDKLSAGTRLSTAGNRLRSQSAVSQLDAVRTEGLDPPERSTSAAKHDITVLASAVAASKLGLVDQLSQALSTCAAVTFAKDAEDRTCLHYAAGYGHEECVSLLLEHLSDTRVRDANGDVPLHFAAIHGHPMCAYNITKACPAACLTRNYRGQTPVEVAVACERGEVLNAMLLACAGDGSGGVTVQAMRKLLASGAVPDTWAPNGSSALMLAAAANGTEALAVLLEAGATLELQDALGRSALMFAAGNNARDTLLALLDAGACISQRDRRGRNVLDYAPAGSEVRRLLQARLDELDAVATRLQQDLLASLGEGEGANGSSAPSNGSDTSKAAAGGKKKKQSAAKKPASGASAGATAKSTAATTDNRPSNGPCASTSSTTAVKAAASADPVPSRDKEANSSGSAARTTNAPADAAKPSKTAAASTARYDGGNDEDASAWRTVASHKCTGKQRQLPEHAGQHRAVAGGVPVLVCVRPSAAVRAATPPQSQRLHGPAAALSAVGGTGAAGPALSEVRNAKPPKSTPAALTAVSSVLGGPASSVDGSSASLLRKASALVCEPAVVAPSGACAAAYGGFKAALLGLEAASAVGGSAIGVAAEDSAAEVSSVAQGLLAPSSAVAGSSAAAAGSAASSDRRPAWGAVKLGVQPAGAVMAVAGCSPRSYPPLGAAATTSSVTDGTSVMPAPSSGTFTRGGPPTSQQPQTASGKPSPLGTARSNNTLQQQAMQTAARQQQQAAGSSTSSSSTTSPPPVATGTAVSSPGDSCAASSSAAAASAPPSVASLCESDVSTCTTGPNTCGSQPGAGTCSPNSIGHDWTRPSPVDVLLQAALAAAQAGSDCDSTKRPSHSKSCSDDNISQQSVEGADEGLSSYDAVLDMPLPLPSAFDRDLPGGCLGVSALGGMEVPPPRRPSGSRGGSAGGACSSLLGPGPSAACFAVGSPTNTTSCSGPVPGGALSSAAAASAVASRAMPTSGTGRAGACAGARVRAPGLSSGAPVGVSSSELARLRTENETLQKRLRQVQQRHSDELASVMLDAEQHAAVAQDAALAQERLRITTNLLAIGLCPEAILAVITPPGHTLNTQQLLTTAATPGGVGSNPSAATALGRSKAPAMAPPPETRRSSAAASSAAGGPASSSAGSCLVPPASPASGRRISGSDSIGSRLSGTGTHNTGRTAQGTASKGSRWESSNSISPSASNECGGPADFLPASLSLGSSPAIAIPSTASETTRAATGTSIDGTCGTASLGRGCFSASPGLPRFGSPGGVVSGGLDSYSSFGSGGLIAGLCGGLGLGILGPGAAGRAGGGMVMMSAPQEDEAEDESDMMDLPVCGDISALLAMSDDDDV